MNSKKGRRFVSHTADVEFVAFGSSREECFDNALMAMFDTMSYSNKVARLKSKDVSFTVKDKANSLEDLLWYAMQDTLSISDSKQLFPYKVSEIAIKEKDGKYSISMKIAAKAKESAVSKLEVKGVARYNLWVGKARKGIRATVVLDV
ncbi:MAG: archease [Candidatus Micrarchaeaceae archaeon]